MGCKKAKAKMRIQTKENDMKLRDIGNTGERILSVKSSDATERSVATVGAKDLLMPTSYI